MNVGNAEHPHSRKDGLQLSIKEAWPNRVGDLLTNKKIWQYLAGMKDPNWRLLIDARRISGPATAELLNNLTRAGIPMSRIITPNRSNYVSSFTVNGRRY